MEICETGGYADNVSLFNLALQHLGRGKQDEARDVLFMLREHIMKTKEVKSETWLLPCIEAELREIGLQSVHR